VRHIYNAAGNRIRTDFDNDADGRIDRIEFDDDSDGTIDRSEDYTFGTRGNLFRTTFDDDNDGDIDRRETYAYDDNGVRIRADIDDDADGNSDRIERYTIDTNGNRIRAEFDDDADDSPDRIENYIYNTDGNRIQTNIDIDADLDTDQIEFHRVDANGRLTGTSFDTDADGNLDRIENYAYDADGNLIRTEFDDEPDLRTDRIERYAYDAGGHNRIRTDVDNDADGRIERRDFDPDGDGIIERSEFDPDEDGNIDRAETYSYDANGRVIRAEIDDDGDGATDRTETYSYDSNGNRIRTDFDDDDDGTADRSGFDDDGDGVFNRIDFDPDGDGNTNRSEFDPDDDGNIDRIEHYTYNADGTLIRTDFDDDADGRIDRADLDDDGDGTIDRSVTFAAFDLSTLDGSNGFTLNGIDAGDYSGRSVSSAGDVNGDGYDDLIIGANRADQGGSRYTGETYVVYGGARAPGTNGALALSALDGANGFTLSGIDAFDFSGFSVSSAGDVNGDGYDDLVIGASYADPNGTSSAGETYVVYGGASAPGTGGKLVLSALDGANGFIIDGIDVYDSSGVSVSSAGDVNGDGYDDLLIGAVGGAPNGNYSGETYVVYGGARAPGTGGKLALSALDGTNGFILAGSNAEDRSGRAVSSAGDVNGDGYDDLIIGAYNSSRGVGVTYVVYGGATGANLTLNRSTLNGTNGFILPGIDGVDQSGYSVSSAGDVNGDGYDDLIIGAHLGDPNGASSGETYVVYGGARAPGTNGVLALSALNGVNGFVINGIDGGDRSGISVSSAGDVNGDGYDDLIIGAYGADPGGNRTAGESYVVFGGARAPGMDGVLALSALSGTSGFTLNGIDPSDGSGRSVSSAGDVNGDGYDDLIIGAREADPGGAGNAGETYVVYGGATGTESTVPITAQGTAAADNFTGNAGEDSFTGIATGDVVRGGAGDDSISVTALDFADIDGGTGKDTLVLAGANLSLDLRGTGNGGVDSVEVFDLSGAGADTLVLDALAVFNLTEERAGGIATLDVLGDTNDRVDLSNR